MDDRENGAGWTTEEDGWPEGVSVSEEEVVKKVVTVAIDVGGGEALQAVISKDQNGEIETVNVGKGPTGRRPPADSQTGPVEGSEFKKFLDALGRVFEEAESHELQL